MNTLCTYYAQVTNEYCQPYWISQRWRQTKQTWMKWDDQSEWLRTPTETQRSEFIDIFNEPRPGLFTHTSTVSRHDCVKVTSRSCVDCYWRLHHFAWSRRIVTIATVDVIVRSWTGRQKGDRKLFAAVVFVFPVDGHFLDDWRLVRVVEREPVLLVKKELVRVVER